MDVESGPQFIREIRGGKNHSKYTKIQAEKLDNEHIVDVKNNLKYYKTHVRKPKKYQDRKNPKIKSKRKNK